jgi:glycine cleavage system H lipoate-binding protein
MMIGLKQQTRPECLWMQAGVVRKKHCYQDYFCNGCQFDRSMNRVCLANKALKKKQIPITGKGADFVAWQDRLKTMPAGKRPCIHHMKRHIEFRTCPQSYHCADCEFDQYFHDQFKVHAVLTPVGFEDISGILLPNGYYLHPGHVWVKIQDQGMVRLGIDDFACRLLGKFDRISGPLTGEKLEQGHPFTTLNRQENSVSFVAPVTGIITEVNPRAVKVPHRINQAPYTDGWLFMAYCPELKQDLKQLLFMESSKSFMDRQVEQLYSLVEQETQLRAADGGRLVSDIFGNLPGISWEVLTKKFIAQGP